MSGLPVSGRSTVPVWRPEPYLVGPLPFEADLDLAEELAIEDRRLERGDAECNVVRLPTRLRLITDNTGEAA